MNEVSLPDISNLSFDRLLRIKSILQPSKNTRIHDTSVANRKNNVQQALISTDRKLIRSKTASERHKLALHIINSADNVIESWNEKKTSIRKLSTSSLPSPSPSPPPLDSTKIAAYEAISLAFKTLYENRSANSAKQLDLEKRHLSIILKLLDVPMIDESILELHVLVDNINLRIHGSLLPFASIFTISPNPNYLNQSTANLIVYTQIAILKSIIKVPPASQPVSNKTIIDSLNSPNGILFWVSQIPLNAATQKLVIFAKLFLALSNNCDSLTCFSYRIASLQLFPQIQEVYVNMLLASYSTLRKKENMSYDNIIQDYGTDLIRLVKKKYMQLKTFSTFVTWFDRLSKKSSSNIWNEANNLIKNVNVDPVLSLVEELKLDPTVEKMNALSSIENIQEYFGAPEFFNTFLHVSKTFLDASQYLNFIGIIDFYLFFLHTKHPNLTKSFSKVSSSFFHHVKVIIEKDVSDSTFIVLLSIYEKIANGLEIIEDNTHLMYISNSLLPIGARLRHKNNDIYLEYWNKSVSIELDLFEKTSHPSLSFPGKLERLIITLIDFAKLNEAFRILCLSFPLIASLEKIQDSASTLPLYLQWQSPSSNRLLNIFASVLLEDSTCKDIEIKNVGAEIEGSILEQLLICLEKYTGSTKKETAIQIMKRLEVLYFNNPLRLLRSYNFFFKSVNEIYNIQVMEELLENLVIKSTLTNNNRRTSNGANLLVDSSKLKSDIELAHHRFFIISCASFSLAISSATVSTKKYQFFNCSVNYAIEMFKSKTQSDNTEKVISHIQSMCAFLDLQGANEKRADLLKAMRDSFLLKGESNEVLVNRMHCRLDLINSLIALGYTGSAVKEISSLESEYQDHQFIVPIDRAWVKLRHAQSLVSVGDTVTARTVFKSLFEMIQNDELLKMPLLKGRPATEERHHFQQRSLLFAEICITLGLLHSAEGNVDYGISQAQKSISFLQGFLKKFQSSSGNRSSRETTWQLTSILINAQIQMAMSYERLGIIREACYYVDEAIKTAQASDCGLRLAVILAFEAEVRVKMGNHTKSTECLEKCQSIIEKLNLQDLNVLYYAHSAILSLQRQRLFNEENQYYVLSDKIFSDLEQKSHKFSVSEMAKKISRLSLTNMEAVTPKSTTITMSTRRSLVGRRLSGPLYSEKSTPTPTFRKSLPSTSPMNFLPMMDTPKKDRIIKEESQEGPSEIFGVEIIWNSIVRSQVYSLGLQNSVDGAMSLLEDQYRSVSIRDDLLLEIAQARNLFLLAKNILSKDPVYSFVFDSVICVPSIKPNHAFRDNYMNDSTLPKSAINHLEKALKMILDNIPKIMILCNATEVSSVASLLNAVQMSLAAILEIIYEKIDIGKVATSYANLVLQDASRRLTLESDRSVVKLRSSDYNWPTEAPERVDTPKTIISMYNDFEHDILNSLPEKWAAVSISVSAETGSLSLCRYEKNKIPLQLCLPLNRHSSRDANEESFSFDLGMQRLREIIEKSNASASSQRTSQIKTSEERHLWWKERYSLDQKLEELLGDVEYFWLGGFKGMFSRERVVSHLLENLATQFVKLLRVYLPSRNWVSGGVRPRSGLGKSRSREEFQRFSGSLQENNNGSTGSTCKGSAGLEEVEIELDPRVLELFVGLGDPDNIKDPGLIEDLTYFVLDILQFHGERNAFDEIEIDQLMVHLETALHHYHAQVASMDEQLREGDVEHTVLVLDRNTQAFPWESIPCLREQSVSRVPSLSILSQLLKEHYQPEIDPVWPVVQVSLEKSSSDSGCYYILNPSRDLPKTQERFESKLTNLRGWSGLVSEEPTESKLVEMLETGNLVIYIGHGSGLQYIRAAKIKSLKRCCATLLLGCSSGALEEAGDYDPWGTPMTYMIAGCPMLLANMWDVTDKDIDLFSTCMLERWGVLPPPNPGMGASAISEAVRDSRDDCNLRFLNGAAPVIYGIPLKIKKTVEKK